MRPMAARIASAPAGSAVAVGVVWVAVLADPAEQQVLVMPVGPSGPLELEGVAQALEHVGLQGRVVAERSRWQSLESVVAIPWSEPCA